MDRAHVPDLCPAPSRYFGHRRSGRPGGDPKSVSIRRAAASQASGRAGGGLAAVFVRGGLVFVAQPGKHRADLGFRVQHGDVLQIAIELAVIEPKAHHEPVGNLKAAIVQRNLHDAARGAVEQGADRERFWSAPGQMLEQITGGESGVDNIFHQQNVLAFDALVQILGDAHQARRGLRIGEAGDSQKIHGQGHGQLARQGGEEEHRTFQNAHQFELAARVVRRNLCGHFQDSAMDLFFGEEHAFDGWHYRTLLTG